MYCTKCGTKLDEHASFCEKCGTKVENTHDFQYQYNMSYSNITDADLEKAYVGKSYEDIKNTKFSLPSFFLGFYYMLYRKMWLLAFLYLIVTIVVGILTIYEFFYAPLISLAFIIIIAINFNKIYLHTVEKRIEKIKRKNSDKSNKELADICKKKGGVSVLSIVISIIVITFISIFLVIWAVIFLSAEFYRENNIKEKDKMSGLEYNIPIGFEALSYNTDTYLNYKYQDHNNYCTFNITKQENYKDTTAEEYLKEHTYTTMNDEVSEIKSSIINDNEWKYLEIAKSYGKTFHYVYTNKDSIYKIEYIIYKDNNICSEGYNNFINSLKVVEIDENRNLYGNRNRYEDIDSV